MLEIIGITIGAVLVILLIPYLLWRWLVSGSLQQAVTHFFTTLHGNDLRVDPEAPIPPSERHPISEVIEQHAEQVKQSIPIGQNVTGQSGIPQASIPATQSGPKPVYEPPYTQNPDTIEPVQQQPVQQQPVQQQPVQQPAQPLPQEIKAPVQPLVEDDTFNVDDPVIDSKHIDPDTPSADSLDADIPDLDSSPYGVRYADRSPGRRLRDKRYRRNSS